MANRGPKIRHSAGGYRRSENGLAAEVGKLLQRAPQFKSLTNPPTDREDGLTETQQNFIDDFATEIRRRAQDPDDGS